MTILGEALRRFKPKVLRRGDSPQNRVVSVEPDTLLNGRVLLSYIIQPFLALERRTVSVAHSQDWESHQIAQTFLDLGYAVDVISYKNTSFVPRHDYSCFIDARWNLERLAPLLNDDCIKIMHIDTAHLVFHDAAECRRLLNLQQRRGVTLRPRRFEMPNLAIEHSDCATILGNDHTMQTYRYANKPLYSVPVSSVVTFPSPSDKSFDSCRRNFIWFGSGGMVHKGLDLVLEAFVALKDCHLYVCGPVHQEEDFVRAYYKELFSTENITTMGWLDVTGPEFRDVVGRCVGMVYPSCSEGQSGSVVNCLHAGLIPIISRESGVDVDGFGRVLQECSIQEVKEAVRSISAMDRSDLETMAHDAWTYARRRHTREAFAKEYRCAVEHILSAKPVTIGSTTRLDLLAADGRR